MKVSIKWILPLIAVAFLGWKLYFRFLHAPDLPLAQTILTNENGEVFDIKKEKANFILVSYVQSWCRDCITEIPSMAILQAFSNGEKHLKIILISDEPWDKIQKFRKITQNLDPLHNAEKLPVYKSDKNMRQMGIHVYPTTYLLGPDRKILLVKQEGFDWNSDEVHTIIRRNSSGFSF